jgi:hypothetical protein
MLNLRVSITNDCKRIIVRVKNPDSGPVNTIVVSSGGNEHSINFPGGQAVFNTVIQTSVLGTNNGVFHVKHLYDDQVMNHTVVIGTCDILCCLAKKMDELLDCNCDCTKCASQLADAQKIFLLIKAAESELAAYAGGNVLLNTEAVIANAEKKYNKAVEMCGGHCGCNC